MDRDRRRPFIHLFERRVRPDPGGSQGSGQADRHPKRFFPDRGGGRQPAPVFTDPVVARAQAVPWEQPPICGPTEDKASLKSRFDAIKTLIAIIIRKSSLDRLPLNEK